MAGAVRGKGKRRNVGARKNKLLGGVTSVKNEAQIAWRESAVQQTLLEHHLYAKNLSHLFPPRPSPTHSSPPEGPRGGTEFPGNAYKVLN